MLSPVGDVLIYRIRLRVSHFYLLLKVEKNVHLFFFCSLKIQFLLDFSKVGFLWRGRVSPFIPTVILDDRTAGRVDLGSRDGGTQFF